MLKAPPVHIAPNRVVMVRSDQFSAQGVFLYTPLA